MREDRGSWYLLTGFVLGVVLGVLYTWVISPVDYVDTTPGSLRPDFKGAYQSVIAAAYAATGDLARAQARLSLLDDDHIAESLALQAQKALAEGQSPEVVHALGLLAEAAGKSPAALPTAVPLTIFPTHTPQTTRTPTATPPPLPSNSPSPASAIRSTATQRPSPTAGQDSNTATPTSTAAASKTPTPTATFLPTRTPTPTPGLPYILDQRTSVCDPDRVPPVLMVHARDASGNGVPGVEFVVTWDAGEDTFFTGLKPEFGLGYGDFELTPGTSYTLKLAEGTQLVSDLVPNECETADGQRIWNSWDLVFVQP